MAIMLTELHCHSRHSDGMASVKEIIRKAGHELGAIAIADHNTQAGYKEAKKMRKNVLLIPAVEITCSFQGAKGHILALGVEEFRKGGALDVMDSVKSSGGLSIVAHPYRLWGFGKSFSQKEIWRKADAVEVLNGTTIWLNNKKAEEQARKMRKSMTSGSDAHWLKFVGKYACDINAADVDSVLKEIKKGRVKIPEKSTSALSIAVHGIARKSKRGLEKIVGNKA